MVILLCSSKIIADGIMNIDDECLLLDEESCFEDSYIFDQYFPGNQRYQPSIPYTTSSQSLKRYFGGNCSR